MMVNKESFIRTIRDWVSSWWELYRLSATLKELWIKKQKKVDMPNKLITKLNSFYWYDKKSESFKYMFQEDELHNEFELNFENDKLHRMCETHLRTLEIKSKCRFSETISKYRNILAREVRDWKFVYQYIDTFWNLKTKEETLYSLLTYWTSDKISPQELVTNIKVRVVISNKREEKMELFNHLWFNGSCQKKENSRTHARWFHDMFYNGWMCVIKLYIWDTFVWRSLARILYDWKKKYLYMDRIYRTWIFAQLDETKVLFKLYEWIYNLWYNILHHFSEINDDFNKAKYKVEMAPNVLYLWQARELNNDATTVYYNSWKSIWIKTADDFVITALNARYFNIYKIEHGSN